ncbi:MAG TPA: DNA primase, partial [Tenacibaculum sp.]|nr:DNA primase [Tenacibaculum sp.]
MKNQKIRQVNILRSLIIILSLLQSIKISAQIDTLKQKKEARSLLRLGNELYNKQKFDEASISYRKALEKDSNYEKATYNYGNSLYQNKNYKEAVSQYELTAKSSDDKFTKAEAFHNIGNAMMEQKQYEKAVESYKNSLRNNPNDDETRYNLAVAQKELKKQQQKQKNSAKQQRSEERVSRKAGTDIV